MKKIIMTALLILVSLIYAGPGKGNLWLTKGETKHRLIVKFNPERAITARNGSLQGSFSRSGELVRLVSEKKLQFERLLPELPGLDSLEIKAKRNLQKRGESDLSHLGFSSLLVANQADMSNEALLKLAQELEALPEVLYCELQATTYLSEPPRAAIVSSENRATETPDYESKQGYLNANPGLNVKEVWNAGFTGKGVRIADIEYDWNYDHEEFRGRNIHVAKGLTTGKHSFNKDHGTCVLGILLAKKDGKGMTGIAYDLEEFVGYPEMTVEAPNFYNRPYSLGVALSQLKAGDIFLYEIQLAGPNSSQYVPAEYDKAVWDLTKAASDAGIIVIATGSNGDQNMDDPMYAEYMSRGNSGAIMVGAGTADVNHNRISKQQFSWGSTYGSRFDVQAWGEKTATTGRWGSGSTVIDKDPNRDYCTSFGGTSGAGPLVASVVALLQQASKERLGKILTPDQVRDLLVSTGIPQGTQIAGKIGPFVNAKAALDKLLKDQPLSAAFKNVVDDNKNMVVEPNEKALIEVEVFNNGTSTLNSISATLSSGSSHFTINNNKKTINSLSANSSTKLSFEITANSFSGTQKAAVKVVLSGGGSYTVNDTIVLGARPKYLLPDNCFSELEPYNNGTMKNPLIVKLQNTLFNTTGTFTSPQVKVVGLPSGLSARLEILDNQSARLYLDGKATNHALANNSKTLKLDITSLLTNNTNYDNSENIEVKFIDPYKIELYQKITGFTANSTKEFAHRFMDFKNSVGGIGLWYYQGKLKLETYGGGVVCNSGSRNITMVPSNFVIDRTTTYTAYMSNQNIVDIATPTYTSWFGKEGYVAFQFKLGNFTRQAWAKIRVDSYGGEFSLLEYAYNEDPLGGLLAGTTTATEYSDLEEESEQALTNNFSLDNNYPNPFNPTTTINFSLKEQANVKLTIYNAKGEFVNSLVNKQLRAGSHSVNFDGANLNSGLYFYRLDTPSGALTKKMLLVK